VYAETIGEIPDALAHREHVETRSPKKHCSKVQKRTCTLAERRAAHKPLFDVPPTSPEKVAVWREELNLKKEKRGEQESNARVRNEIEI